MSRLKTNASQAKQYVEQHISHIMDGYDGYHVQKDMGKIFDKINLSIQNSIQLLQTSCAVTVSVNRKKMAVVYERMITNELTAAGYQVQNMTVTYSTPDTTPITINNTTILRKAPEATLTFTISWS